MQSLIQVMSYENPAAERCRQRRPGVQLSTPPSKSTVLWVQVSPEKQSLSRENQRATSTARCFRNWTSSLQKHHLRVTFRNLHFKRVFIQIQAWELLSLSSPSGRGGNKTWTVLSKVSSGFSSQSVLLRLSSATIYQHSHTALPWPNVYTFYAYYTWGLRAVSILHGYSVYVYSMLLFCSTYVLTGYFVLHRFDTPILFIYMVYGHSVLHTFYMDALVVYSTWLLIIFYMGILCFIYSTRQFHLHTFYACPALHTFFFNASLTALISFILHSFFKFRSTEFPPLNSRSFEIHIIHSPQDHR